MCLPSLLPRPWEEATQGRNLPVSASYSYFPC